MGFFECLFGKEVEQKKEDESSRDSLQKEIISQIKLTNTDNVSKFLRKRQPNIMIICKLIMQN